VKVGGAPKAPLVLTAADVALAVSGTVVDGDAAVTFEGVTTDSRRVGAGQLFIALQIGRAHV